MKESRRDFIKKSAISAAGISVAGVVRPNDLFGSSKSKNDKVIFGLVGINGRGKALLSAIVNSENAEIGFVCDVDSRVLENSTQKVLELTGKKPKAYVDFRKLLEEKSMDAIAIATPEHWHAPMAIMGMQAGKHVYLEKPCSHNPEEGEMLVTAQKKYGKLVQLGTQQRSAPTSFEAIKDIRDGMIGEVYHGKAWYARRRDPIGVGKVVAPPDWLNWELWQGPAPRADFKDNLVHYNWHWIKKYGTGEINNNATHEIDICRWALGVDLPVKVSSTGGRFYHDDDWEFFDTQNVGYEYADGKLITWEGMSCNGFETNGRDRGVTIHGANGTAMIDRNSYILFDKDNNAIKEVKEASKSETTNVLGRGALTDYHMQNFVDAIRKGTPLNAPIEETRKSTLHCHLGNISQFTGRTLNIDDATGHVVDDKEAVQYWSREYEPGWELKI